MLRGSCSISFGQQKTRRGDDAERVMVRTHQFTLTKDCLLCGTPVNIFLAFRAQTRTEPECAGSSPGASVVA